MNTEKQQLLVLKGLVSEMKEEDREKVIEYKNKITELIKEDPENVAIGMSMACLEIQLENLS